MVSTQEHNTSTPIRVTFGSIISLSALMDMIGKKASQVSKSLKSKPSGKIYDSKTAAKSPIRQSKQLLTNISNKAMMMVQRKKKSEEEKEDEFGDGGIWQREIMMGDKCQPLDFSGVIYYDSNGKQVNDVPFRSPRSSPLPGYLTRAAGKQSM